ncbi:hypothetical protein HER32_06740 [Hymenobacter sp. BT18]|uniref:hypothetical protein n=1 Tax=Hymenobacter sp. BT18 TaxID=2835648 RepID=UPI00143E4C4A|nr:hypothetical protein [Hymenobacter sp. BT18]QIX60890.1 hypothetical protein HER32_06740 [Hymenobacter sp. BT18]
MAKLTPSQLAQKWLLKFQPNNTLAIIEETMQEFAQDVADSLPDPDGGSAINAAIKAPIKTNNTSIGFNPNTDDVGAWIQAVFYGTKLTVASLSFSGASTFEAGKQASYTISGAITVNDNPVGLRQLLKNGQPWQAPETNSFSYQDTGTLADTYTLQVWFADSDQADDPDIEKEVSTSYVFPLMWGAAAAGANAATVSAFTSRSLARAAALNGTVDVEMTFTAAGQRMSIAVPAGFTITSIKDPDNGQILGTFSEEARTLPFAVYPDQDYGLWQNNADFTATNYKLTVTVKKTA